MSCAPFSSGQVRRRTLLSGLAGCVAAPLALAGCTTLEAASAPADPGTAATAGSGSPAAPSTSPAVPPPAPSARPNPISVQALIEKDYDGRDLEIVRKVADVGAYRTYQITYRGDGLRISGMMYVPAGRGPFPVLVVNHGYVDPRTYDSGQGLTREHDHLARHGYVVVHTDYRSYAGSSDDPDVDYDLWLPYAVDTINAVQAVKASKLAVLDRDRIGWLGRSMGGAVTLTALVAQPGLVGAAVVYSSASTLAADNWRRFYRDDRDRRQVNRRIEDGYGLPDAAPAFWRAASARTYLDRVTEPVLLHHGEDDGTCPPAWSTATLAALRAAGQRARLYTYPGEKHIFHAAWRTAIDRTVSFFDRELA